MGYRSLALVSRPKHVSRLSLCGAWLGLVDTESLAVSNTAIAACRTVRFGCAGFPEAPKLQSVASEASLQKFRAGGEEERPSRPPRPRDDSATSARPPSLRGKGKANPNKQRARFSDGERCLPGHSCPAQSEPCTSPMRLEVQSNIFSHRQCASHVRCMYGQRVRGLLQAAPLDQTASPKLSRPELHAAASRMSNRPCVSAESQS